MRRTLPGDTSNDTLLVERVSTASAVAVRNRTFRSCSLIAGLSSSRLSGNEAFEKQVHPFTIPA